MRKLFLILTLVLATSGAYSQTRQIIDMNGHDWVTWDSSQKSAVILGLLSCVGPFTIDMYLPAMPTIANDLHASIAAVQTTIEIPKHRRAESGGFE